MGVTPQLTVNRNSPIPLYHQLVHAIESEVAEGRLPPGTMLTNELDLARELHLSRPTVRRAMDELVRSGLLVRKRGVGTQVVASEVRRNVQLSSLYDDLDKSNEKPTTAVLEFRLVDADATTAEKLGVEVGAPVQYFRRLRRRNGAPLALMENWVSPAVVEFTAEELAERGLYAVLREAGINFRVAQQTIGASVASEEQAKLLETTPGAALVTMARTATDDIGRRIETGRHVYRADSYSFEMTLSA